MEINQTIKPNLQIRAFYMFFIFIGVQIGVGIIGAPRFIYAAAERDSWISILIAFVYTCLVVWVMLLTLKQYPNADFFGIHVDIFGVWLGKLLATLYILYHAFSFLSILLTYIEVVQIFLYQALPNIVITGLIILIVGYAVMGGIRIVVGATFLFFLMTFWLLFILYDPFIRMDWDNLLPLFQSSFPQIIEGTKATAYTISGFEILYILYPFIQNKNKLKVPIFLGLSFTFIVLLVVTIISIGYFSPIGLKSVNWALLILFKSASFTFIERLDYIVICAWMLVILPNLIILLWSMTYGIKRLYKIPQRITLYIVIAFMLIVVNFFQYDYQISNFTDLTAKLAFWIVFIYPFVLYLLVILKKKFKKRKGSGTA
ncbi:GerAB/ArcD/ProY family transporter [Ornithinibacillus contaminans]|uniref:GerAB/ArcD/ProY family transporter n=1 Tax=Ornithinibacillus contaminans TaxID=694055 RepID=UPI00064D908B|nr:GerAB/ArcD/ProY family transporter [Ornithinibacillus contaminans]